MDEFELFLLISKGESETVDFKQELDLESARSKAEFIKDVISIANSSPIKGYLIIGVDKNNLVVGIDKLEEEQLQQIAYTYISPPVNITCSYVSLTDHLPVRNVGVIEIRALKKPHKVARTFVHIQQDDVFIRRGSVVMKASPEEIIQLHKSSTENLMNIQSIFQRAKAHFEINNFDLAISLLTEAINILPNSELLISRGKAYEELAKSSGDYSNYRSSFKDYSNSLNLKPSLDEEKAAKLGRIRLLQTNGSGYTWEDFEIDYKWLYDHTDGYDRAEVIYTYVNSWEYENLDMKDNDTIHKLESGEEMVRLLDEAISLGFNDLEIFYLRSFGNKVASNYGTALRDIDKAISITRNEERKIVYMCHRAEILVKMAGFNDAYETLVEAKKIDNKGKNMVRNYLDLHTRDAIENILCLFGLDKKFYGIDSVKTEPIYSIVKLLLICISRRISRISTSRDGTVTKVRTELDDILTQYPHIVSSLTRLLSVDEKDAIKNWNSDYMFTVRMPAFNEQVESKIFFQIPLSDDDDED